MGIYAVQDQSVVEYTQNMTNKEKTIEDFLEKHPKVLGIDIMIIGRQVPTGNNGIIDIMGIDKNGSIVIIEIKRNITPRSIVSQIIEYACWVESINYNELNSITKKHQNSNTVDLYKKFEDRFGMVPDFNQEQILYIIAERIDDKTAEMCRYLNMRGLRIICTEIKFYEKDGKQLIGTDIVVGNVDEYTDDGDDAANMWEGKLAIIEDANRKAVIDLIERIEKEMKVVGSAQNRWYKFTTGAGYDQTKIAFVILSKKTARFAFRCDPDQFNIDDERVKDVKRWFFKHEKRIQIVPENFDVILECARHALNSSNKIDSRSANKAVESRRMD